MTTRPDHFSKGGLRSLDQEIAEAFGVVCDTKPYPDAAQCGDSFKVIQRQLNAARARYKELLERRERMVSSM